MDVPGIKWRGRANGGSNSLGLFARVVTCFPNCPAQALFVCAFPNRDFLAARLLIGQLYRHRGFQEKLAAAGFSMQLLGLFGKLPVEIRLKIYSRVFEGQVIHCCSSKSHSSRHGIARAASPISPCSLKAFEKECLECCESDFEPAIGAAKVPQWTSTISYSHSLFTPGDLLSLLLTCKALYDEAEPLLWDLITLSIGLPQFGAFCDRFLLPPRDAHILTTPRGQLLKNLQLFVPDSSKLGSRMGSDHRFRHLSSHLLISTAIETSIFQLASCTGLRAASLTISASLAIQDPDPELRLLLDLNIIHFILRMPRPRMYFNISYLGQLRNPTRESGENYDDLPDTDICKRKLDVLSSLLIKVVLGYISLGNVPQSNFLDEDDPSVVELQRLVQGDLHEDASGNV